MERGLLLNGTEHMTGAESNGFDFSLGITIFLCIHSQEMLNYIT